MKNLDIYTYLSNDAKLWDILKKSYNYKKVDQYENLLKIISTTTPENTHIFIIDIAKLTNKKLSQFRKDFLSNKYNFVIVYWEDISEDIRFKLYEFEIFGIIDNRSENSEILLRYLVNQAKLHIPTRSNRLAKGLLEYYNLEDVRKKINYILSYLSYKYEISSSDISEIRLVLSCLLIAFKTDNILKVSKMLHTMMQSHDIDMLYKQYTHPKSFKQSIIAILLLIYTGEDTQKYLKNINMKNIEINLIDEIIYINDVNLRIISSDLDINYFWEQLDNLILEKCKDIEYTMVLGDCTVKVYKVLKYSLSKADYLKVWTEIDVSQKQMDVHIKLFGAKNSVVLEYINKKNFFEDNVISIGIDDELVITVKPKTSVEKATLTIQKNIISKDNIENMHYKDEEKISAENFLKEFEVDQYLLDDLKDNETDIKDILFSEDTLSAEILVSVSETFNRYIHILKVTIEFEDIAYSLESLSLLLKTFPIDSLDETKKSTLRFYIQGLINDLSTWKQYIFIEPNTPDIHYLDASLLENCFTIEKFISSDSEDNTLDDEDDLEFF